MNHQTTNTEPRIFHHLISAASFVAATTCREKARIIHRLPRCWRLAVNNSACSLDTHQVANRGAKTVCANQPQLPSAAFLTTQAENPVIYSPGSPNTRHPFARSVKNDANRSSSIAFLASAKSRW
jgi:hypothetical protein